MMIQSIHKGRTVKEVVILDTLNETDEACIVTALGATGETKSSLFGWNVKRYDDGQSVVVSLHTD